MKKIAVLFFAATCFSFLSLTGCGSGESTVVEAPPVVEEQTAIEGMSDEDYNKAMEESMNQ